MARSCKRVALAALAWAISAPVAAQTPEQLHAGEGSSAAVPGDPQANLRVLAAQSLQALLVNDGSRLPKAGDFRFTENGQPLAIGDGMWGTLTGLAGQNPLIVPAAETLQYRFDVVDSETSEILALRAIDENGTQGVLALRLKLRERAISEMEAITVHEELSGSRGGTVTLLQPQLLQMLDPARLGAIDPIFAQPAPASRASLIAAANAYFDGQVAGSSRGIPFAAGCVRRDNAHDSTGDAASVPLDPRVPRYRPWALGCGEQVGSGLFRYIERVRDRRFVVDIERGVVAAIVLMDVPGTVHAIDVPGHGRVNYPGPAARRDVNVADQFDQSVTANLRVPSSVLSVCLFKVRDGQIAQMECFHRGGHLGLRSGWP